MSLDDLESWGLQFEKLQKLKYRWSAPPTAEKMHIPYAAPMKQATRKMIAATSVSGEVAAATRVSAPPLPLPQQQQQRSQQQSPPPEQQAAGVKGKGRNRSGRGKARNEGAPSEHSTPSAASPLPIDITGQVEAAVAAAVREHTASWRLQGNAARYLPPQGYPPLPPPSAQHTQVQQPRQ